ncbi:MAG: hypothetical protein U5J98_11885 [Halobacteriales archaeon]|nr:hypothetical protein [Halobacteriales archaeon]
MASADDAVTIQIDASDGTTDSFDVPATILERLSEGDEPAAGIAADVALMAFAGRAHALVHHGHGEADEALEAAEQTLLDDFEARFGVTYAEATGHSH